MPHESSLADATLLQCVLNGKPGHRSPGDKFPAQDFDETCAECGEDSMASAIPTEVRQLLLRIVQPPIRADGTREIVTAQEASETLNAFLET